MIMSQLSFSHGGFKCQAQINAARQILTEMNSVVLQARLTALIEPVYPKGKGGCLPYELETMLRIHFAQQPSAKRAEMHEYPSKSIKKVNNA